MVGRGPVPIAQGQVAVTVTVNAAPVQGQGQSPAGRGGVPAQGGRGMVGRGVYSFCVSWSFGCESPDCLLNPSQVATRT